MSEHTPGPWRVAVGNRLEIRGPKDEIGWPVPVAYNVGLHTDEVAQANARLIAAAPQLLQALHDLVVWVEHLPGGRGSWEYVNARATITKLKGENK